MKYNVDQELCIGCGMCESLSPDVFKVNGEGKAEVVGEGDGEEARGRSRGCCRRGVPVKYRFPRDAAAGLRVCFSCVNDFDHSCAFASVAAAVIASEIDAASLRISRFLKR